MKAHVAKFLQFLDDKEGKRLSLKIKLLNPHKFKITKDDLNVDDNLNLSNTNVTSLPDGLYVGKSLYLTGCTSLKTLPNGLKVGWDLYLKSTLLAEMYNAGEIEAMIKANGGYVNGRISTYV